jgi:hypothetical protein
MMNIDVVNNGCNMKYCLKITVGVELKHVAIRLSKDLASLMEMFKTVK